MRELFGFFNECSSLCFGMSMPRNQYHIKMSVFVDRNVPLEVNFAEARKIVNLQATGQIAADCVNARFGPYYRWRILGPARHANVLSINLSRIHIDVILLDDPFGLSLVLQHMDD